MNLNRLRDNVLIQYTIISFSLTLIVAFVLSWQLSIQMRNQLIYSHGDFYRAYAKAINDNYSEIIPIIRGDVGETVFEDEHSHNSSASGEEEEVWDHFESDLIQFPYVKQFRIINSHGEVVWKYRSDDYIRKLDTIFGEQDHWAEDVNDFIILPLDESIAVGYTIPINVDGELIGLVQVIDIDPDLKNRIGKTQARVIFLIFIGGVISHIILTKSFHVQFDVLSIKNNPRRYSYGG